MNLLQQTATYDSAQIWTQREAKARPFMSLENSPQKPAPLILSGRQLPWMSMVDYLGMTLTEDGELLQDCKQKRAAYIDKCAQVRESFHFSHPMEKLIATEKYCSNIHGSVLWDYSSREAQMVFSAWRTGAKISWDVPRSTHTYFVQEVLTPNILSLELRILRNFVGFFQSLLCSPSTEISVLARRHTLVTGKKYQNHPRPHRT